MATRIAFSTHWPDRMGEKAGEPNYFPEKIWQSFPDEYAHEYFSDFDFDIEGYDFHEDAIGMIPKTQTIRKNYDYWKEKEGKMIQPFIWAGNPYRSKQEVFCPEVRLGRVSKVHINTIERLITISHYNDERCRMNFASNEEELTEVAQADGFDSADDFFLWFNEDFEGALLEFGI